MKKTKQGVRDLNSIAPKRSRGYKPSKEAMELAGVIIPDMSPPTPEEMFEEQIFDNGFYDHF